MRAFAVGTLVAALAITAVPTAEAARPAESPISVWRDDFDGPAGARPDARRWQVDGAGHHEAGDLEVYRDDPANVGLDGHGHLRLTATPGENGRYWSARLLSVRHDLLPPEHGLLRIEARVQPAAGPGVGTSMWTWGNDVAGWPANGEIDIAEQLGREPSQVHTAIQCPTCHPNGPPYGLGTVYTAPDGRPYSGGFHTFAVTWTRGPDRITWSIDGRVADSLSPDDTGADGWVFDQPEFLLLALRVGGPFVGDVDPATIPATALVDSVTITRLG
ncbi:glycoside hydrolase family 16 protein [Flindersiella endophytica]